MIRLAQKEAINNNSTDLVHCRRRAESCCDHCFHLLTTHAADAKEGNGVKGCRWKGLAGRPELLGCVMTSHELQQHRSVTVLRSVASGKTVVSEQSGGHMLR